MSGAVLAVDPGSRRVGIAISDPSRKFAIPLTVLGAGESLADDIAEIVAERAVTEIVVGLPIRLDGGEGPSSKGARRLAKELEGRLGLPVTLVDERLSTVEADRALSATGRDTRRRRASIDRSAAAVILQTFLDSR